MTTLARIERPAPPEGVGFYGGPFSNFVGGPIAVEPGPYAQPLLEGAGVYQPACLVCAATVEHYFQAMKATTLEAFLFVLCAPTPGAAKGRGNSIQLRGDWDDVREQAMYDGLIAKFTQYRDLQNELLATRGLYLYEDSPTDAVWGRWDAEENDWTGQNLLGEALMMVREEIRGLPEVIREGRA